jgi:hypothetical protein
MIYPKWLWSIGWGCYEYVVSYFVGLVCGGNQSNLQSSIIPRYLIFETTFSSHKVILGWLLYVSLFLINIGINAALSLEISNLCFLHQSSMVRSVVSTVVSTAEWEEPWIISRMSSANVKISRFGALDSSTIKSLTIMFDRVGPETDLCGWRVRLLIWDGRCDLVGSPWGRSFRTFTGRHNQMYATPVSGPNLFYSNQIVSR